MEDYWGIIYAIMKSLGINELEKYGKQRFNEYAEWKEECKYLCYINGITEMLDKLQELKGSDSNEE